MRWSRGCAFAAAAAVLVACSSNDSTGTAPPPVTEAPSDGGTPIQRPLGDAAFTSISTDAGDGEARAGAFSDAQILAVLDLYDIAFDEDSTMMVVPEGSGATATRPSSNPKVTRLANDLIAAHAAYADERRALASATGIGSDASTLSAQLSAQLLSNIEALRAAGDAGRDAAYVRLMIAYQTTEIQAIDTELAPSASNGALRAYLGKLRGNLQIDLNESLSVASELGLR